MKIPMRIELSPGGACLNCHVGVLLNMTEVNDASDQFHVYTAAGLLGYNNTKYIEGITYWLHD